jgi:hypothetical protein
LASSNPSGYGCTARVADTVTNLANGSYRPGITVQVLGKRRRRVAQ